jgi:hypothetical protein
VVILGAVVWYFATEERNQPDTGLGLDANVQAFWFAVSGSFSVATTLVVTSLINHGWGKDHGWDAVSGAAPPVGVTWLARTTFFHAIKARITYARSSASTRTEA